MLLYDDIENDIAEKRYAQALDQLCAHDIMRLDSETFEELKKYMSSIPKEMIAQIPIACFTAICIDLRCDQFDEMRRWHSQLAALRDSFKEGTRERAIASQYLSCAGLMMPKIDNARLLLVLAILFNEHQGRYKIELPIPVSLTCQRPSVLRGAKDLSEWGKNYRAVASIVTPMLTELFIDNNHGITAAAIAELLYEYNDLNAASVEVAAALSCTIPEVAFAGMAQVTRISRASASDAKRTAELLSNMERMIQNTGSEELMSTYLAMCVRFDIHAGQLESVTEWLENCGVDELQCTHAHSYELMTKAQALIAVGCPRDAVTLLERILLVLREDFRPLDTIECLAHCAVACELLDDRDRALDKLEEALRLAEPYRYIRVIADRGSVMLRLLSQLHKESSRVDSFSERYMRSVLEATRSYATLHPTLYTHIIPAEPTSAPELTAMEIQILHLLEEGKSNKEISSMLSIKLPTVKFHLANLFEKLGAPNRTAAVNTARNLCLL